MPTPSWRKRYQGFGDEHTQSVTFHDVRHTQQTSDLDTNGFICVLLSSKKMVKSSSTKGGKCQLYIQNQWN